MSIQKQNRSNTSLNLLAGIFLGLIIVTIGWLSFSQQTVLNDVYATGTYVYQTDKTESWPVAYTAGTFQSNDNIVVSDSLSHKLMYTDKNASEEKKAAENNETKEANMAITLLMKAFNYLYQAGIFKNPF